MKFTTKTKLQYKLTLGIHLIIYFAIVIAGIIIKINAHTEQFEPLLNLFK